MIGRVPTWTQAQRAALYRFNGKAGAAYRRIHDPVNATTALTGAAADPTPAPVTAAADLSAAGSSIPRLEAAVQCTSLTARYHSPRCRLVSARGSFSPSDDGRQKLLPAPPEPAVTRLRDPA